MRRLIAATTLTGLILTGCAADTSSDDKATAPPTTTTAATTTTASTTTATPESADEAAYVAAAQIAVGGSQNLPLTAGSGLLTGEGEAALEFGYTACSMSVEELHDLFFESWPEWRGPRDTPDQLHAAAHDHLCR